MANIGNPKRVITVQPEKAPVKVPAPEKAPERAPEPEKVPAR